MLNYEFDGRNLNPFNPPCDGDTIRIGDDIWERWTDGSPWVIRLRKPGTREFHPTVCASNVSDFIFQVRNLAMNAERKIA